MKKKSSYYDREYEKAKLELMKTGHEAKYGSSENQSKAIVKRLIKEQQEKISAEKRIRQQEKKVYEHSVPGKLQSFLKEKQKGEFIPPAIKKILKKGRLNALKAITKGQYGGLVSPGETGYFKKEYNKEAKWLS
jgi:hypothetical protein